MLGEETDCVLIFLQLETLSPDLGRGFAALSPVGLDEEIDRIEGLVRTVLTAIRQLTPAMLLWHGFETPQM